MVRTHHKRAIWSLLHQDLYNKINDLDIGAVFA
jgi:hypothetical protein